ncbi:DUF2255 family protein [Micromonospora pallida]|uniref:DUF2255 family protein n=1 Tax=Micromonospora pallida TaxID=145854 RepID=UPI00114CF7D5|nr:DUF2255 family protein [Micromonospora pallida]
MAHETTTSWTSDELTTIGHAEELQLARLREDGTLRPYMTIWVGRASDQLYVPNTTDTGPPSSAPSRDRTPARSLRR